MGKVTVVKIPQEKKPFEEYFNQYYQQLLHYLKKKVSSAQSAEDLAMDTFTLCFQKFESFDPAKASFGTWLYVIANSKLKNYYRDQKIFDELDETLSLQERFEDSILAAEYLHTLRDTLYNALESLPEIQRKIVIQKYFYSKTSKEIALLVGLTPGNVRQQLSRALDKLKKYFQCHNIQWEN